MVVVIKYEGYAISIGDAELSRNTGYDPSCCRGYRMVVRKKKGGGYSKPLMVRNLHTCTSHPRAVDSVYLHNFDGDLEKAMSALLQLAEDHIDELVRVEQGGAKAIVAAAIAHGHPPADIERGEKLNDATGPVH